ncbi:MAG: hypothetical protein ACRC9P_09160 [Bacteroides sp.]
MKNKLETRFFVKILLDKKQRFGGNPRVVYYRNSLKPDLYFKWRWYFEYLKARLVVKYPRGKVELMMGPYEYELPSNVYREKLTNMITAAKRNCTIFDNKVKEAKRKWHKLFPIEEDPSYFLVRQRRKAYHKKLSDLNKELAGFESRGAVNEKVLDMLPMIKTDYINHLKEVL